MLLPDSDLLPGASGSRNRGKELLVRIAKKLYGKIDPTRLFVRGSYINHPDHRAVAQAAIDALSPTAAMPLSFQEQVDQEGLEPYRVRHILVTSTDHPDTWVDIGETIEQKIVALRQHVSQLDGRRDYEGLIRQWAVNTGAQVGIQYAEAFMQIQRPPDNER